MIQRLGDGLRLVILDISGSSQLILEQPLGAAHC